MNENASKVRTCKDHTKTLVGQYAMVMLRSRQCLCVIINRHYSIEFFCRDHMQDIFGGTRGVMVIVLGNGHGDTSSNPG